MKVFRDVSSIDDSLRGAVLTVGNFDGVHLGHQRILRTAHALAKVSSAAVLAMTFEPHPLALLHPERAPERLTPWEEKLHQLERAGADAVVRLETDWPLLSLTAEDFVREILVKRIHPSYIVEGPNFGFGRDRKGNVDTLKAMAPKGGFIVHVVEPYRVHTFANAPALVVSSTAIRRALAQGDVATAAICLGRPYRLVGTVVHGAGAGKKLGFPTINLDVDCQLLPAEGVYAGIAEIASPCGTGISPEAPCGTGVLPVVPCGTGVSPVVLRRPAAVSIGRRPTLHDGEPARPQRAPDFQSGRLPSAVEAVGQVEQRDLPQLVLEAHVLDESGDWYAKRVYLELVERLRDQVKFPSREALTGQIARDIERVREIVAPHCHGGAQPPSAVEHT